MRPYGSPLSASGMLIDLPEYSRAFLMPLASEMASSDTLYCTASADSVSPW